MLINRREPLKIFPGKRGYLWGAADKKEESERIISLFSL
jgi:hypothetical protein